MAQRQGLKVSQFFVAHASRFDDN
ncbi:unnamed protein product [Ectocarpus sp. CCAP 1310/34]|nr:unnamed protein product [Ectocarpus sp. CCAP 1310/34]